MKYIHDFTTFVNENLNEGKNYGDMTAAIGGGDDKAIENFFNNAKVGDTFDYAPNGVELLFLPDGKFNNAKEIDVEIKQTSRDAKPVKCKIVGIAFGENKVYINDPSGDYDDEQNVIYFTMQGDKTVYVLTDTF